MRVLSILSVIAVAASLPALRQDAPPRGQFGLSRLSTASGAPAAIEKFGVLDDCSLCHARQTEEFDGSFHSASHRDPLYRAFAELARKEAGEEVYAWCAGCHSPPAVASGLVPGTPEAALPDAAKSGVQCDVCHQVAALTGTEGPWHEPGNASFSLDPGEKKASLRAEIKANKNHTVRRAEFLESAEFCASCHTVIHPIHGLRIEHTYDEWKRSVYAEKGIVCQDCHMRTVEDASEVAATLTRKPVIGRTSEVSSVDREIHPHYFVGGNVDAERLTGSAGHAAIAEARLKSAATLAIEPGAAEGDSRPFTVAITNVGAGHALPTSLTELREMWLEVSVRDAAGAILLESGRLDVQGELAPDSVRFGAQLLDAHGSPTIRPWEAVSFGWRRLIAPKATERAAFRVTLPAGAAGAPRVDARLLYRVAAPHVLREVMGEHAFVPRIVEMAAASGDLAPPR